MKNQKSPALLTCLIAAGIYAAPIYNLYNAHRAMRVDDLLTVVVVESAKAGSQSGTNTNKQNDMSVQADKGSGLLKFLPSFGASGSSKVSYDGTGATTREGSLDAKISAKVVQVFRQRQPGN